jgi:hypothetical protein
MTEEEILLLSWFCGFTVGATVACLGIMVRFVNRAAGPRLARDSF